MSAHIKSNVFPFLCRTTQIAVGWLHWEQCRTHDQTAIPLLPPDCVLIQRRPDWQHSASQLQYVRLILVVEELWQLTYLVDFFCRGGVWSVNPVGGINGYSETAPTDGG